MNKIKQRQWAIEQAIAYRMTNHRRHAADELSIAKTAQSFLDWVNQPEPDVLDIMQEKFQQQAQDDWWIKHDGKGCPVPHETIVDVRYLGGEVRDAIKAGIFATGRWNVWDWSACPKNNGLRIIEYRVVKP